MTSSSSEPRNPPPSSSSSPTTPTDTFVKVRVVGTVRSVGACIELEDDNGVPWSLLGPEAADLRAGERVAATGRSRPESPGCDGAPLVVHSLQRLT